MDSFEGLLFYERVLLVLGCVMFAFLLVAMLIYIFQKRPIKGILYFFIFPIVMIGWSGIQKISYGDLIVDLEDKVKNVRSNPSDAEARRELQLAVKDIEERAPAGATSFIKIAEAQAVLGDTSRAIRSINQALKIDPSNIKLLDWKRNFGKIP